MYRYSFRFVVTTITILTANLLTTAISNYMTNYKNSFKPLIFTLIGMAITVVVFYPLFMKLEVWVTNISAKVVRSGRSLAGKYLGLLISFVAAMLVLVYFYARMWYHIDILKILLHVNIRGYIK
ncbi:MAG: hypothetical protein MUC93_08325 [Bacteroidales bacterium]|nr:hypothetical protein [Bacteroidales bacterium]